MPPRRKRSSQRPYPRGTPSARLISAREAREQQLLFDSLGNQLKTSVPAADIKATVTGMLDELKDDIAAELK
jgi:hypothetical protein